MSNISYFGRPYKPQVWNALLEGYGIYKLEHRTYCVICAELGFKTKSICYTDVYSDYYYGRNQKEYERSLKEQIERTWCKYHTYMLFAEGVTDNP